MIEILQEPRPLEEGETKEPRNIRQIGSSSGENMIYMEDYVYRFLHSSTRKKNRCAFVLLGELKQRGNYRVVYIKGALELTNISFGGGLPVFSEDMWDAIYRQCRQYFPCWSIVGWALQTLGGMKSIEPEIKRISERHFPGNHGSVFVYDAYGEWEQMYLDVDGQLYIQDGFCIYYEKNTPMGSYLSAYHAKREEEILKTEPEEMDRFLVHDEIKHQAEVREDAEAMARYRAFMNGQQERAHGQKMKVALSIAVVVMVLLSGVLIQNYATLSDMEDAVEAISNQDAVEKARDEVVKEVISKKAEDNVIKEEITKKATELEEVPTDGGEQVQKNVYLEQGYYIVEPGDKLNDISKKIYGTEDMVDAICEKNQIDNIDHIQAGDKIELP